MSYTLPPTFPEHLVFEQLAEYLPNVLVNMCKEYFSPNQWMLTRGAHIRYRRDSEIGYEQAVVVDIDQHQSILVILLKRAYMPPLIDMKMQAHKILLDETQRALEPLSNEEVEALLKRPEEPEYKPLIELSEELQTRKRMARFFEESQNRKRIVRHFITRRAKKSQTGEITG